MMTPTLERRARRAMKKKRMLARTPWCAYCGCALDFRTATFDHVVPRARGGGGHPQNVVLACERCNGFKADHPVEALACPRVRGGKLRFVSDVLSDERDAMPKQPVGFNYDATEKDVRVFLKDHAKHIHALLEKTSAAIVEIGRRLHEVRKELGPSAFQAWLKGEFRWSQPTASNYMQAAEKFGTLECLDQIQPSALICLARGNVDPRAVEETIKLAEAGEVITRKQAVEAIAKFMEHRGPAPVDPIERVRSFVRNAWARLEAEPRKRLAEELAALAAQLGSMKATPEPESDPERPATRKARRRTPAAA